MAIMPLVFDILALCMLLWAIRRASQQGFLATLAHFLGYLVAAVVAWPAARLLAQRVFTLYLRQGLQERVAQHLAENPEGGELLESAAQLLDALPNYAVRLFGADEGALAHIADALEGFTADGAGLLVDNVLAPVVTAALSMVLFTVIFSLLLLVVRMVVHMLGFANRIPIVGPFNSILGGCAGVLTGSVSIYLFFLVLKLTALLTGNALAFLNLPLLEQVFSFRLLRVLEPFGLL